MVFPLILQHAILTQGFLKLCKPTVVQQLPMQGIVLGAPDTVSHLNSLTALSTRHHNPHCRGNKTCLLYTSDAADEDSSV